MKFVQIIEMRTDRIEEIQRHVQEYEAATEGRRTRGHTLICRDRDDERRYLAIVEFASHEDALKNDALPETGEFARKLAGELDGPPTFSNLDVIDERG